MTGEDTLQDIVGLHYHTLKKLTLGTIMHCPKKMVAQLGGTTKWVVVSRPTGINNRHMGPHKKVF